MFKTCWYRNNIWIRMSWFFVLIFIHIIKTLWNKLTFCQQPADNFNKKWDEVWISWLYEINNWLIDKKIRHFNILISTIKKTNSFYHISYDHYMNVFTNPSTGAGCDTISIFKVNFNKFEFKGFLLLDWLLYQR